MSRQQNFDLSLDWHYAREAVKAETCGVCGHRFGSFEVSEVIRHFQSPPRRPFVTPRIQVQAGSVPENSVE